MSIKTVLAIFVLALQSLSQTTLAQDVFDSDGDGFDDNSDNCTLVANPAQRDTDGDFNGNMCDPDFNNDNIIDFIDFQYMQDNFFTADPDSDLNGDGNTNFPDLQRTRDMFFGQPGPTGTNPDQPPCNCYFSSDCNDGDPGTNLFCYYGPGSFSTEDNCAWREVKPNGNYLTGCSTEADLTTGAWQPNMCDGFCTASSNGSSIGLENQNLIAQTISYWGDAMINPSARGGGPVDSRLAAQALAMPFSGTNIPLVLGRQTADALAMAAGDPFHDYFCHWEGHPEDDNPPVVDLAGDTCLITSGQLTVQALSAEIQTPGSAAKIMQGIVDVCPNWQQMFATQCEAGPGALNCAIQFIQAQAYFLRTPPVTAPFRATKLMDLLKSKKNVASSD